MMLFSSETRNQGSEERSDEWFLIQDYMIIP